MLFILPIFSSLSVFLALIVEEYLAYPHIVEEAIKLIFVYLILRSEEESNKFLLAMLVGASFGITETILYTYTSLLTGGFNLFLTRLIITVPLHTLTTIVIYYFGFLNKRLLPIGFVSAIFIHYVYNLLTAI